MSQMVPCPDGGKCGTAMHDKSKGPYKYCAAKASRSGTGKASSAAGVAPNLDSVARAGWYPAPNGPDGQMRVLSPELSALRTKVIDGTIAQVSIRFYGDKVSSRKRAQITDLSVYAFDAALSFGYVQDQPPSAVDGKTHTGGYWFEGPHEDDFEATFKGATELLSNVVNSRMETDMASTGGTRMAITSHIVEEVLDNLHMEDFFAVKP